MPAEYRAIPVDLIDASTRRTPLDPDWMIALAESITRHGQRTPIEVVASGNRFRLVTGGYRLAACRQAKIGEINAAVYPAEDFADAAQERLAQIAENVLRRTQTVLERAMYVSDWRAIYEATQGVVRRGRKKLRHDVAISASDPHAQASAAFSANFSEASQRALGLNPRAVQRLLRIAGLDADTRDRIALTDIADNQADLLALAGLAVDMRGKVLDLLFSTPPEATSVADAIVLAEGRRLPSSAEKLLTSVMNNFSKLSDRDRRAVFAAHEDEIRAYAQEKGWL